MKRTLVRAALLLTCVSPRLFEILRTGHDSYRYLEDDILPGRPEKRRSRRSQLRGSSQRLLRVQVRGDAPVRLKRI